MIIELLACLGCGRTVDHLTMFPNCKRCGSKHFRAIGPSPYILLCWFINNPKHVIKLFIEDLKEKR